MIANLPMYHRPELDDAHDVFWRLIRENLRSAGIESPENLAQTAGEMDVWLRNDLILSQACGMPYRKVLHGKVTLIGTPDYGLDGCPPGFYRSAFVTHKEDERTNLTEFKDALFAYNNDMSQSGLSAAKTATAKAGFSFTNRVCSGGHLNSAKMVASKRAEIASIDAMSLALMSRYDDFYGVLKILCWTEPTPGLPFITRYGEEKDTYFKAIKAAIDDLPKDVRDTLMIKDLIDIPAKAYLAVT